MDDRRGAESGIGGYGQEAAGRRSLVLSPQSAIVHRPSSIVVLATMLLFTAWFSAYSISLHEAHRTHKADLGQIDLAIWNTAHGRFVQEIKDDQVSTRLTDHVEPIFLLVAPVFRLWDDVRALLIFQAAALAAGAWPIYLLARKKIAEGRSQKEERAAEASSFFLLPSSFAEWGAVVFALAYLLAPALQAAAVAEFHALALAPIFIAWALWAVESRRWGQFAVAAILLMGVQEGMALLAVMLGLYAAVKAWRQPRAVSTPPPPILGVSGSPRSRGAGGRFDTLWRRTWHGQLGATRGGVPGSRAEPGNLSGTRRNAPGARAGGGILSGVRRGVPGTVEGRGVIIGAAIALIGLAWFYVATFVIIPHYAEQAYGLAQTPYVARYGQLGDSFGDVLKALVTRPWEALRIAAEPSRVRYLIGLLLPTGFLALLGPEILLLSLPLLLANLFSSFPMQYFGELHYSAPLVPYFIAAAVVGLLRFREQAQALPGTRAALMIGLALVAAGALIAQLVSGYTVIGREFQRLGPGWPQVTAHDRLLARFAAQIPDNVPLSVATDLYPHFSHRSLIYQFPWLGQAEWVLVDVAGTPDRHPADIQREIGRLLEQGWGVVDAADGYLLLAKGKGSADFPEVFFSFARAPAPSPQVPLDITFGDRLRLLGYDLVDDPKWRRTALRFYWVSLGPLPDDTGIALEVVSPDGTVVADGALQPAPALLWYPPARWRPGETVVVETLLLFLPRAWAPVVAVKVGSQVLMPQVAPGPEPSQVTVTGDGQVSLAPWERQGGWLAPFLEPREKYPTAARFSGDNWDVRLTDTAVRTAARPGQAFPVNLRWASDMGPAPRDYRVFLHLRDASGHTVATGDATPTWFAPLPVIEWPRGFATWGAHALPIPADLAAGEYTLVIGWYDPETGKRLSASSADGNAEGSEYVLGKVVVNPLAGPRPDLCCLMASECCASQE